MNLRQFIASFVLTLGTFACLATEESIAEACKDAESASYNAIHRCQAAIYREADAELNKKYAEVLVATKESPDTNRTRLALVASQRAWVTHRDRTCELASLLGGDGYEGPHRPSSCMSELTSKRINELQGYLGCLNEGGMKCPWP